MDNRVLPLMNITEAFEAYRLDVILFRNQSVKTEENHKVCRRALIKHFGDVQVSTLDFQDIRRWKQHLDKHRSPATVRNYIIKLRVVFKYLQKRGIPVLDPETIPIPNRVQTVPSFLSNEQVRLAISGTRRLKNKAIVALLYASGVRVSELCSLNRDSIHEKMFTVVGKGGKARLCFLDERAQLLIDLYLETRTDSNKALFLTDAGLRISPGVIQDTFRSIRKATGLEVSPHTLRHSFATNLLKSNCNIRYVQVLLGHSSLQTTQMYTHVVDADLQREYEKHHTL